MGVYESPQHCSGAMLQITPNVVAEPTNHGSNRARARKSTYHGRLDQEHHHSVPEVSAAKNVRMPESLVFGSTDMHEEKNIVTVTQSIYRLRGTGQVELFREVLQFIAHLSVVFRMHWFGVDQDWRATGCQDQR